MAASHNAAATAGGAWHDHQLWVELFALLNFAGLIGDIFLAHSQNHFARPSEYIPLYFSALAAVALAVALWRRGRSHAGWLIVGLVVGWAAVLVGLAGVILHLRSGFFAEHTIRSLTYAAPFAAPLAYTGLGLLLIANRMVDARSREWAHWILLLALGGFCGNFVFSLTDHAQNGFFNPFEWIPVIASAAAIGFLVVPFLVPVTRIYLKVTAAVLVVQALAGAAGAAFHLTSIVRQPAGTWFEKILSGAPPMAPFLFPNLAALAAIALWVLHRDGWVVEDDGPRRLPAYDASPGSGPGAP